MVDPIDLSVYIHINLLLVTKTMPRLGPRAHISALRERPHKCRHGSPRVQLGPHTYGPPHPHHTGKSGQRHTSQPAS